MRIYARCDRVLFFFRSIAYMRTLVLLAPFERRREEWREAERGQWELF